MRSSKPGALGIGGAQAMALSLGVLRLSIIAAINHPFTDSFPLKGPKILLGVLFEKALI